MAMEEKLLAEVQDRRSERQGLSRGGGDALNPHNGVNIRRLVKRVRKTCPGKDIWLWTGYRMQELNAAQSAVLDYLDVLIDGRFVEEEKAATLQWRGSRNQIAWQLR